MAAWNDAQYLKFGDERTRAARELLARVPLAQAQRVIDLGCGPGNSTALLRERWPAAHITGVDSSPEMLARARRDAPNIKWVCADAAAYLLAPPMRAVDIWQTIYAQVMPDVEAIVEWVKGTGLRPYLDDLDGDRQAAFLDAYRPGVAAAYPARADGKRLFSFPRLFVVAVR